MKPMLLASLFALAVIGAGCSKKETVVEAAVKPIAVKTGTVQQLKVDRSITVTGSLLADEQTSISSEVAGRITTVGADFGSFVSKGQVLIQLDTRELQIAVERSKANLAQALARVGLNPDQADVRPTDSPAIKQARAQYEDAKSKYDRAASLLKTGDVPEERAIEAEKTWRTREAALEAAKDELRTQLANIQSLKAEVRLAEKRLTDGTIRAPFDGMISERQVTSGQFVKENVPMMTLVKTRPLRLRMTIPEDATGLVRIGTPVKFTTDAAPGQSYEAQISRINARLDDKSRTLEVEARVTNPDTRLRPGVFVTVQLTSQQNVLISAVPKQAVATIAGLTKVFLIDNGHAIEKRIPPGEPHGDLIEVPADIRPGAIVALNQLDRLSDKAQVEVK